MKLYAQFAFENFDPFNSFYAEGCSTFCSISGKSVNATQKAVNALDVQALYQLGSDAANLLGKYPSRSDWEAKLARTTFATSSENSRTLIVENRFGKTVEFLDDPSRPFPILLLEVLTRQHHSEGHVSTESNFLEVLGDLYAMHSLAAIDDAILCLTVSSRAGSCAYAILAADCLAQAYSIRNTKPISRGRALAEISAMSRRNDASNLKKKINQLYSSKTWSSKAEASRKISAQVGRVPEVILRYLKDIPER
jgi:hypothetical protein